MSRSSRGITEGLEQNRNGEFAPPIDADVDNVLGVDFHVDPGPPDRDDAGAVDDLAAGMGFALVMIEKNTRRAVQLTDDHPLGPVDDKRALFGHQGNRTEINLLFFDVADVGYARLLVDIVDDQTDP